MFCFHGRTESFAAAGPRLVLCLGSSESRLQRHYPLAVCCQAALLTIAVPVLAVALVAFEFHFVAVVAAPGAVGRRARHAGARGAGLGAVVVVVRRPAAPRAHGHHILTLVAHLSAHDRTSGAPRGHGETDGRAPRRAPLLPTALLLLCRCICSSVIWKSEINRDRI